MFIYIVQAGDNGPVKIGFTKNLALRLSGLHTVIPNGLRVLRTVEGTLDTERWFHERFAASRRRHEWFDLHPDMLTVVPPDPDSLKVQVEDDSAERSDLRAEMRRHILMIGATMPVNTSVKAMRAKAAEVFGVSLRRIVSYHHMTVRDPKAREVDHFRTVARIILAEHADDLDRRSALIRAELKRTADARVAARVRPQTLQQTDLELPSPVVPFRARIGL